MTGFNQTHMIFIVLLVFSFTRFFVVLYETIRKRVTQKDDDDGDFLDKDVAEDIDLYWKSLEGTD